MVGITHVGVSLCGFSMVLRPLEKETAIFIGAESVSFAKAAACSGGGGAERRIASIILFSFAVIKFLMQRGE